MLYKYNQFLNENFYDEFKSRYIKLFDDSDDDFKNQLGQFFKKIDSEHEDLKLIKIFDDYLSVNQTSLNDKIDNSTGENEINTLLSDNLKTIFFALKSIKIKLNDKDFSNTFEKSQDKNLQNLMSMKMDDFSDAVATYAKSYMIPQIEKTSGIESTQESKIYEQDAVQTNSDQTETVQTQTDPTQTQTDISQSETESNEKLTSYKDNSKEWFSYIYGMVWNKLKETKNKLSSNINTLNNLEQLSISMKNSTNEEAKKQLLKKITSLEKDDLNKLGEFLNLNLEDIGDF